MAEQNRVVRQRRFPIFTLVGFFTSLAQGDSVRVAQAIPGIVTINLLAATFFSVSLYLVSLREHGIYRRLPSTYDVELLRGLILQDRALSGAWDRRRGPRFHRRTGICLQRHPLSLGKSATDQPSRAGFGDRSCPKHKAGVRPRAPKPGVRPDNW